MIDRFGNKVSSVEIVYAGIPFLVQICHPKDPSHASFLESIYQMENGSAIGDNLIAVLAERVVIELGTIAATLLKLKEWRYWDAAVVHRHKVWRYGPIYPEGVPMPVSYYRVLCE